MDGSYGYGRLYMGINNVGRGWFKCPERAGKKGS